MNNYRSVRSCLHAPQTCLFHLLYIHACCTAVQEVLRVPRFIGEHPFNTDEARKKFQAKYAYNYAIPDEVQCLRNNSLAATVQLQPLLSATIHVTCIVLIAAWSS